MKVLQTIGGFSVKSGGTSTCTYDLLSAIYELGRENEVDLLTPSVSGEDNSMMGHGEDWIKVVPNDYCTPLSISRNLSRFLKDSDYDIYHTNGMWMHVNHTTCAIARSKGRPYIITPHGMLYPEALARSAWKKWPLRKLWFDMDIREATCVHVTCMKEMQHLRRLGYKGPIAIIANPVNVPQYTEELIGARTDKVASSLKIGFLGRLHPIKKIENILYGVVKSECQNVRVYIIGKGDEAYESFLRTEAERFGLSDRVHFLGFVNGREKYEWLAQLDALFVPSDMENFGMIVPEALIVGTPVMASLGTPWESLNAERCGWWCDNSPEKIAEVIDTVYCLPAEEHRAMGLRGRDFAIRAFAVDKVARQMIQLYRWIVIYGMSEEQKPNLVYYY